MRHQSTSLHRRLWILQIVLALVFVVAGGVKLVLPAAELAAGSPYSVGFMRFIGICELLGALGLVLPGLTGIRPALTTWAGAGLCIIMVGATATMVGQMGPALASFPLTVGLLTAYVTYQRQWLHPHLPRVR